MRPTGTASCWSCGTSTSTVRDELARQSDAFGADLGAVGEFRQPYETRRHEIADEVLAKPWPDDVRDRLETDQDPIILVIDRAFGDFDPLDHPFAIIWLSDFMEDPRAIRPMLVTLARLTRSGDDVIGYLRDVAERERRRDQVQSAGRGVGLVARVASYVELKPAIFGVSIDVKAVLRDIAESRRGR